MVLILLSAFFLRGPLIWKLFHFQGEKIDLPLNLLTIENQKIEIHSNKAIIFWASWCGPCKIELGRVSKLLEEKKLNADQILAISIDTNRQEMLKAVDQEKYVFPVIWDFDGTLSEIFKVEVTPSIFVLNKNQEVIWATSGISPLLTFRLNYYLN